ncbi:conserved hypothetical protein [Ricinus communis]|uniref:Uncharacterized protein n=1 Tax=Ricinus communis TaxID=3988 RepID=B9T9W0_RICCO|nr:conserved hypothetical protein [Ricinus communis]
MTYKKESMDNQTARYDLKQAQGWIDWNDALNVPNWKQGKTVLDGRFSADELRAFIEL